MKKGQQKLSSQNQEDAYFIFRSIILNTNTMTMSVTNSNIKATAKSHNSFIKTEKIKDIIKHMAFNITISIIFILDFITLQF